MTKLSLPEDRQRCLSVPQSPAVVRVTSQPRNHSAINTQQSMQSMSCVDTHPGGENVVTWGEAKRKDVQVLRNNLCLDCANEESRGGSG